MERSTYAEIPHKFEAGTPPIVQAVGLGAAVEYLGHIGMDAIHRHEQAITAYALDGLATVPGLTVLGPLDATARGGAISFEIDGVHPHDVRGAHRASISKLIAPPRAVASSGPSGQAGHGREAVEGVRQ